MMEDAYLQQHSTFELFGAGQRLNLKFTADRRADQCTPKYFCHDICHNVLLRQRAVDLGWYNDRIRGRNECIFRDGLANLA